MEDLQDLVDDYTSKEQFKSYVISGLTILSAVAVRKLVEYIWKQSTNEEPPKNPAERSVSWQQAFMYTILTGITVSIVKLIIRRNLKLELDERL
ncbi:MAG: DUF4235 domain-containing protein [Cyclobacteriaceae bacterium]